jgi:hypothetical protein
VTAQLCPRCSAQCSKDAGQHSVRGFPAYKRAVAGSIPAAPTSSHVTCGNARTGISVGEHSRQTPRDTHVRRTFQGSPHGPRRRPRLAETPWTKFRRDWLVALRAKGKSPNTLRLCTRALDRLAAWGRRTASPTRPTSPAVTWTPSWLSCARVEAVDGLAGLPGVAAVLPLAGGGGGGPEPHGGHAAGCGPAAGGQAAHRRPALRPAGELPGRPRLPAHRRPGPHPAGRELTDSWSGINVTGTWRRMAAGRTPERWRAGRPPSVEAGGLISAGARTEPAGGRSDLPPAGSCTVHLHQNPALAWSTFCASVPRE